MHHFKRSLHVSENGGAWHDRCGIDATSLQYNTISTVHYNTVQCSTVQYSTFAAGRGPQALEQVAQAEGDARPLPPAFLRHRCRGENPKRARAAASRDTTRPSSLRNITLPTCTPETV